MKLIKKIIGLILGLFIIVLVSLLALVFVVDFNEYKPLITDQVEQATGRQLDIQGDIKITVWPWLGLQVERAELSNAEGFVEQAFAKVDKFDLKLELMPLLQQQINIDKILLHGLTLSLQRKAQGQSNWDDLLLLSQKQAETGHDDPSADEPAMALDSFSIKGIEIKNGRLNWHDNQSQTQASLDNIDLQTGAIELNKNIPLSLSAHAKLNQPQADIQFNLDTEVNIDMEAMHAEMSRLAMEIRILTPDMATQNTLLKLTSSLSANLNEQQYKINNLVLSLNTKGYQLPGGELNLKLRSSSVIDLQKQTAVIESMQIESTGMHVTTSAKVSELNTEPVIEGKLKLAEFNPLDVAQIYKITLPAMSDANALKKMQAQFHYHVSANELELINLSLELDDSVINGQLSMEDFTAPRVKYDLKLNTLKLDRYLPTPVSQSKQRARSEVTLSDAPVNLPVESLRKLNINGVFKADRIDWQDYRFEKTYIKISGKDGVIVANPVNVRLFDGRVAMAARLDVRNKQPKYSANVKAQDLQLASAAQPVLLNLLNEKKASLNGLVNLNARLGAQGNSVRAMISSLKGQVDFRTGKTQLKNADIEHYLRQRAWYSLDQKIRKADKRIVAALRKNNFPTTEKEFISDYRPRDKTAFNVIRARANISEGVINNYDFLMASERVNITGKGAIYLTNQSMDYVAVIDLHRTHNSLKDKLLDIPLTVNLNGSFSSIKPQPDMNAWLSKAWSEATSQGKKTAKKKIKQKAKDKFKDMLKQWQY